jgi:filamentous hemagglutinin
VELAMQNTPLEKFTEAKPKEMYVVYYQKSNNVASELIVAAYEKHMAKTFGYTNPDVVSAALIQQQGDNAVLVEGHSRGSLVVDNALAILKDNSYINEKLFVNVYGPAVNQQRLEASFAEVNVSEDAKPNYVYQTNDPVSTVVGDAKGGLFIPSLLEFWNVIMTNNSAHSCYGTGAPGCKPFQAPPATSTNGQ